VAVRRFQLPVSDGVKRLHFCSTKVSRRMPFRSSVYRNFRAVVAHASAAFALSVLRQLISTIRRYGAFRRKRNFIERAKETPRHRSWQSSQKSADYRERVSPSDSGNEIAEGKILDLFVDSAIESRRLRALPMRSVLIPRDAENAKNMALHRFTRLHFLLPLFYNIKR